MWLQLCRVALFNAGVEPATQLWSTHCRPRLVTEGEILTAGKNRRNGKGKSKNPKSGAVKDTNMETQDGELISADV